MRIRLPLVLLTLAASLGWADPPFRVARLSYLAGAVSYLPHDAQEWATPSLNYPLTTGDTLWSDRNSRIELQIGSTSLRLGDETSAGFLNLDDRAVQVRLTQGTLQVRLRHLDQDQVIEIDTPNGALSLLRPGDYRIDTFPEGQGTVVAVHSGELEVTGGGTAFPLHSGDAARLSGGEQLDYEIVPAAPPDEYDRWCRERDREEEQSASARYIGREVIGYQDLDRYGRWQETPEYGAVWVPTSVDSGWAPYRTGHWAFVPPWGWTWIDASPWGFAPFHYGRWATYGGGWIWVPGPVVARPVYAPALVAFVGGSHFHLSANFGGGGVAWFPLGPREVYVPSYRVSPTYVQNVNSTNVRNINVTNITNVTNVTYVNQRVATTVVPQEAFIRSRPVHQVAVAVSPQEAIQAAVLRQGPEVAIPPRAFAGSQPARVLPPAAVLSRSVVAKEAPPVLAPQPGVVRPAVVAPLVRPAPPVVRRLDSIPGQSVRPPANNFPRTDQPGRQFGQPPVRPPQPSNESQPYERPVRPPVQPNDRPVRPPAQPNDRPFRPPMPTSPEQPLHEPVRPPVEHTAPPRPERPVLREEHPANHPAPAEMHREQRHHEDHPREQPRKDERAKPEHNFR